MEKLTKLFAALVVNRYNFSVLHWGITGDKFDAYHNLAEEYTEKFSKYIDDVAEIMLMKDGVIPSLLDCIKILDSDREEYPMLGTKQFTFTSNAFDGFVSKIFNQMIELYEDAYDDDDLPDDITSVLEEHCYWIRKELDYKLNRRR